MYKSSLRHIHDPVLPSQDRNYVFTWEQYVVSPVIDTVALNSVMLVETHLSGSQV